MKFRWTPVGRMSVMQLRVEVMALRRELQAWLEAVGDNRACPGGDGHMSSDVSGGAAVLCPKCFRIGRRLAEAARVGDVLDCEEVGR